MRFAYVNGRYVPHHLATVAMEDRGYQFADGIYEVIVFHGGRLLDETLHMTRLKRSLAELDIPMPMPEQSLASVIRTLIAKNSHRDGIVYIQVTRGVAPRNHLAPKSMRPVLTMSVMPLKIPSNEMVEKGVTIVSRPDERWGRCDIKAIGLLANTMAKRDATAKGGWEALLVEPDGTVTEGSATNAFMVKDGIVVTHPASHEILGGVRRSVLGRICSEAQVRFEERAFSLDEAKAADEFFLSGATTSVLPVTRIDDATIGSGEPGPVTKRLIELYRTHVRAQTAPAEEGAAA